MTIWNGGVVLQAILGVGTVIASSVACLTSLTACCKACACVSFSLFGYCFNVNSLLALGLQKKDAQQYDANLKYIMMYNDIIRLVCSSMSNYVLLCFQYLGQRRTDKWCFFVVVVIQMFTECEFNKY